MSDRDVYLNCGPELCVAATKSFVSQLIIFYLLTFAMLNQLEQGKQWIREVSSQIKENLNTNGVKVRELGSGIVDKPDFYFLARGINLAIALEAALKLKEISYIHAEGYAAGELKHGPFALLGSTTPVVAVVAQDNTYEPVMTGIKEIKARKSPVMALVAEGDETMVELADSEDWMTAELAGWCRDFELTDEIIAEFSGIPD